MSERATQFHANPWKGVFYATGGGSSFIHEMLGTAGASATVLEARVPYAFSALTELLGRAPEQAVSETTARQLAVAAYERADALAEEDTLFGFGLTAALATNRVKKGACRVHWAIQTATRTATYHTEYPHELDRTEQEALLLDQVWMSLASFFDEAPLGESIESKDANAADELAALLREKPAKLSNAEHDGLLLLPGSFDPLHDGHREMLEIGERMTGLIGAYELCVHNADKPNLDFLTIQERLDQFPQTPIWLTNAGNFVDKAKLFPGVTFLLGIDTLVRVGDPRFYNNSDKALNAALGTLAALDARFIVFGRNRLGTFERLSEANIPEPLRDLCTEVPQSEFDNPISSTEIRRSRIGED